MKNITLKVKALLRALITIACVSFIPNVNAYTTTSTTLCGDTCTLNRNNNLYMVINTSIISPDIKGTYSFREGYGRNVYFNHPTMYGIFLGTKFNDRLGMEIGYETQHTKTRMNKVGPGEVLPGPIHLDNDVVFMETSARTEHFQALLNVNLNEHQPKNNINFWGQVGASYSQIRASQNILFVIENLGPHARLLYADDDMLVRTFKRKRIIPVVKLGMDCNITEKIGIRASVGWSNLKLLRAKSKERPSSLSEIRLGDEYNVALGIVYKFW